MLLKSEYKSIVESGGNDNGGEYVVLMSMEEVHQIFTSVNVCLVQNWEETKVRGRFEKVEDAEQE